MRFQCSFFFVTIIVSFNIAAINGVFDLLENFDIQNILHLYAFYDMQTVAFCNSLLLHHVQYICTY